MRERIAVLVAGDPRLAGVEPAAGPLPWRVRPAGFAGLLQAITAQMISSQAASAIWCRIGALPDALTPAGLLDLPEEALRAAGFSRPKVGHARSLARAYLQGRLFDPAIADMDDTTAIATLTAVPGLGPWTAEVYLLFALGRADVFPAGDVALAASAADLLGLDARPGPKALRDLAARWQPNRALAARLLWHHWRFRTGRPSMDDAVIASG